MGNSTYRGYRVWLVALGLCLAMGSGCAMVAPGSLPNDGKVIEDARDFES